jgi:hypothetical protein
VRIRAEQRKERGRTKRSETSIPNNFIKTQWIKMKISNIDAQALGLTYL